MSRHDGFTVIPSKSSRRRLAARTAAKMSADTEARRASARRKARDLASRVPSAALIRQRELEAREAMVACRTHECTELVDPRSRGWCPAHTLAPDDRPAPRAGTGTGRVCAVEGCDLEVAHVGHRWCSRHQGPGRRELKGRDR